jgi:hypothetical protein
VAEETEDEYKIKPILERFDCNQNELYESLVGQFEKVCVSYMSSRDDIRKATFREVWCCLTQAFIDCHDSNEELKLRVKEMLDSIEKTIEE